MSGLRKAASVAVDVVPGGRGLLTRRRNRRFARRISRSGLFDLAWYEAQRGRKFSSVEAAVEDYVAAGDRAGWSPTPLFEPDWYNKARTNPGPDRLFMYLSRPKHQQRRSTHLLFDPGLYKSTHEGAAKYDNGPLAHFMAHAKPATELEIGHLYGEPVQAPWGEVRATLEGAVATWRAQERLRTAPRRVPHFDQGKQERFLSGLARAADPEAEADGEGPRPVVSVVMPVWNRSAQLRRAVESIQAQTLTDWELIVVDDGSTDDSPLVLQGLSHFDPRIKVIHQERSGVSRARNRAIEAARGDYVAFLDSDNTWTPGFLRTMLRAMAKDGLTAAYSAMEIHDKDAVTYRGFDGGREFLLIGNHIDLNVLVARTPALRQIEGFKEDLRRAVDYDLVLRLSEITPLSYLPFIGAIYTEDRDDTSRISVAEPLTWDYVVRSRHVVDWAGAEAVARVPGRLSIVVPVRDDVRLVRRCVQELLRGLDVDVDENPVDLEIVVLDIASRRSATVQMAALALGDPRVHVHRVPVDVKFALGVDCALPYTTGEFVGVAHPRTVARPGWAAPLLRALRREGVAAVQPVAAGGDGAVVAAGATFTAAAGLPSVLLAGMPIEDVLALGTEVEVPALAGPLWITRAEALLAARDLDCLFSQSWHETDLSLRLAGSSVLVTESVVDVLDGGLPDPEPTFSRDDDLFLKRWRGTKVAAGNELWRAAGLEIVHHRTSRHEELGRVRALPVLTRRPRVVAPDLVAAGAVAPGTPSLRWAIKIAAPAGPRGRAWGDWHFAQSLAEALRRLGQEVVVDTRESAYRPTGYLDDVNLVLRGLDRVEPDLSRINLMWVISHPDMVTAEELSGYDRVFAASTTWSRRVSADWATSVEPLLQCTDAHRFTPEAAEPDTGAPILFVGNSRRVFRPVVQYAMEAKAPLTVYGGGWEPFLPAKRIAAPSLPNELVPAAYAAAGVVLNDHWDDMRLGGFISNRVFDVLAVGGRLLTDRVEGLDDVFPGAARTWAHGIELVEVLDTPVERAFPSREDRLKTAALVAAEHSFDARARQLLDAALDTSS